MLPANDLIGEKYIYPWSIVMIDAYGSPETLKGTDNQYWIAYFPKGEFTITTDKKTDEILHIVFGKISG